MSREDDERDVPSLMDIQIDTTGLTTIEALVARLTAGWPYDAYAATLQVGLAEIDRKDLVLACEELGLDLDEAIEAVMAECRRRVLPAGEEEQR